MENNDRKIRIFKILVQIFAIYKDKKYHLLITEKSFTMTKVGKSNVT